LAQTAIRIGDYDITLLRDGVFSPPDGFLVHPGGEAALKSAVGARTGFTLDVNCYLVRGPGGTTLIDAGVGTTWGDTFGHARTALQAAGVTPAQIDQVLLTHLHSDHALGLFDGEAAWLKRAEIFVPAAELAYFTDPAARAAQPEARRDTFDTATRLGEVYAGRLHSIAPGAIETSRVTLPGIEVTPLPGHTPGHSGFIIRSPTDTLLIWADTVHVEDLQTADPDVSLIFDVDAAQARRTRLETLERVASEGWMVAGGHLSGFGRVERAGGAFRFVRV
jgi:glyoxylase-like metal-dependent hydrolase (beta-lactamase superfamily II)